MAKYGSIKNDIEKFDGSINFGLWQIQVKDILIQAGLHKALCGPPKKPVGGEKKDAQGNTIETTEVIDNTDWMDLDLRAVSAIRLCLAKNVLINVAKVPTAKELWETLENLYMTKSLTNRLYLKERFHLLRMAEDTKISDHLSAFNEIVSELEAIGVKIDDEDKALRLVWSLPPTYKHLATTLMYGKESVSMKEVTSALISEEIRGKSAGGDSNDLALVVRGKNNYNKFSKGVCWGCGKSGHLKRDCKGAAAKKGSKSVKGDSDDDEKSYSAFEDDALLMVENIHQGGGEWIIDGGATQHICMHRAWFGKYKRCGGDKFMTVGGGSKLPIRGVGNIQVKMYDGRIIYLYGVRHVPEMHRNLISLSKLDYAGWCYTGLGGVLKLSWKNTVIMRGILRENLYIMIGETICPKEVMIHEIGEGKSQSEDDVLKSLAGKSEVVSDLGDSQH